jgi:copper transport protein
VNRLILAGALTRWTLFAAILLPAGAAVFRFAVLPRIAGIGVEAVRPVVARRIAGLAALGALLVFVCALARFPLELREIADRESPLGPQARALAFQSLWGAVWLAQLGAALATAALFGAARRGGRVAWLAAAAGAVLLAATPALSGHAIGSDRLTGLAVAGDVIHVLAAAAWLGGMLSLFVCIHVPGEMRQAGLGGAMVAAFAPVALTAAATGAVTGLFASWLHLGAWQSLWQSRYGLKLALKVLSVGLMASLGARNWRVVGPKFMYDNEVEPMQRSIRAELVAGALVLLATALLVVASPPGE